MAGRGLKWLTSRASASNQTIFPLLPREVAEHPAASRGQCERSVCIGDVLHVI